MTLCGVLRCGVADAMDKKWADFLSLQGGDFQEEANVKNIFLCFKCRRRGRKCTTVELGFAKHVRIIFGRTRGLDDIYCLLRIPIR